MHENTHPCFVALTRPPMLWMTTLSFAFANTGLNLLLYVLLSKRLGISFLFFGVSWAILQGFGILACKYDVRWFDLLLGKLSFSCINKTIWGCDSYEPY